MWRSCYFLLFLTLLKLSTCQFDASQCRIAKGCHIAESKEMGVAWNLIDDETLELELFVNSESANGKYVAVGFSDDHIMGNEPVVECSAIGDEPASLKFSFDKTKGKGNERIDEDLSTHFSDTSSSFENGVLYCKGKVKVGGHSNPKVFKFDPSAEYHLLLANGKTTAKGLSYHKQQSAVSRKVRLAEVSPGFDKGECGTTKGCTLPTADSCYNVDGNIGASYRVVADNQIEFEIFGPANTTVNENVYVALGFSDDEKMNDISVIECSRLPSETRPTMKFSYNPGFKNARIDGEEPIRARLISQSESRISDGTVYCRGVVNVGGDASNDQIFKWNSTRGYHLMFAAGPTDADGLSHHTGSCVSIVTFLDQVDNVGFNDLTCGSSKGCFIPTDCSGGCDDIKASWTVLSANQLHLELSGNTPTLNRYIAMGFSTNGRMGNASVVECSSFNNESYGFSFSYNQVGNSYKNLRPTTDVASLFSNQRVQYVDGVLYCSADVRVAGDANDLTVFRYDPAANYSIILATGETTTNGTVRNLGYHHTKRSVAPYQTLADYTTPTSAPAPSGSGTFDSTTCGTEKACFTPKGTSDTVAYRVISNDSIEFEIYSPQASASGVYTALGFSTTGEMSPAQVIECSSLGTQPLSMKFSSNSGTSNSRIDGEEAIRAQYITNTETSYADGNIYCKGTVKSDGNANAQIFKYDPAEKYYLLVAKGSASTGGLGYHGTDKYVSDQRLLSDVTAGNGSGSKVTLIILHAIFMTVAWMTMVPIAVIFARVLRSSWPTVKPGGLLIWFHIHRGANLIGIALMIAGFVMILVHKDWTFVTQSWNGAHAIVGVISLCLAWLQPFISTLRCSPNDPRRPIFNYIHRGIGVIAMALATTAICIAGYHFFKKRQVAQLVLALIPISVIVALSVFFLVFNSLVDVDTKSFGKSQNGNSSSRTDDIPMRPTSQTETERTWTIRSPPSDQTTTSSSSRREVPLEKKRLWVNRFREFVVYGAVLVFIAIGTILSVFFALGLSSSN